MSIIPCSDVGNIRREERRFGSGCREQVPLFKRV